MKKFIYGFLALAILAIPIVVWATSNTEVPNPTSRSVENSLAVGVGGGTQPSSASSNGVSAANRNLLWKQRIINYNTTTTSKTIYQTESGTVFCVGTAASNDVVTFLLPVPTAGLLYSFNKSNTTSGCELWITATTGVTINGGTAGKSYKTTNTGIKQTTTLLAISSTAWIVLNEVGTFSNDNS